MQDFVLSLQQVWSRILTLLADPASNLTAAFLLYGIIALVLLLVLIVAIMFLMGAPDEEAEGEVGEGDGTGETSSTARATAPVAPRAAKIKVPPRPMDPRRRLIAIGVSLLVVLAVWVATGYTTSDSEVCKGCHGDSAQHLKTNSTDPHAQVRCVACHESSSVYARYFASVPRRLTHFVDTQVSMQLQDDYGYVATTSCSACHSTAIAQTTTNETRGLRVSHKEPLEASATCLDCHMLRDGVVGTYNAGMAPCLRCHDSKQASSACVTCHDENAASAARSRTTSFTAEQIVDLKCGGCHNEKRDCDTCHGMRLPHTREFMAYAHARAGAVDIWYNNGKNCTRCHTPTRRPCTKCHTPLIGKGHGGLNMAISHQNASASGCSCHQQYAYIGSRNFCTDLCHTPAAIAGSPR